MSKPALVVFKRSRTQAPSSSTTDKALDERYLQPFVAMQVSGFLKVEQSAVVLSHFRRLLSTPHTLSQLKIKIDGKKGEKKMCSKLCVQLGQRRAVSQNKCCSCVHVFNLHNHCAYAQCSYQPATAPTPADRLTHPQILTHPNLEGEQHERGRGKCMSLPVCSMEEPCRITIFVRPERSIRSSAESCDQHKKEDWVRASPNSGILFVLEK